MDEHLLLEAIAIDQIVGKSDAMRPHQIDIIIVTNFFIVVVCHNLVRLHSWRPEAKKERGCLSWLRRLQYTCASCYKDKKLRILQMAQPQDP